VVKPGRVMFEMSGVDLATATEAMKLAAQKLPIRTTMVSRLGLL
jgi:large subunit ribosomal protein L16